MTSEAIRVLLADDHAPTRDRIRRALEQGGCVVVGEASTAEDAVLLARSEGPDVAMLDIHMPGGGIHAAAQIVRGMPEIAVVMLTHSREDDDLFDSLRAGATGYLLKSTEPTDLTTTLRGVLAGEAAMSPRLVTRVLDEFRAPTKHRFRRGTPASNKLSSREWEVMELLAEGASTEEAADRLFLSATTIRVHVSSVLRKLHVRDRESAFRVLREE